MLFSCLPPSILLISSLVAPRTSGILIAVSGWCSWVFLSRSRSLEPLRPSRAIPVVMPVFLPLTPGCARFLQEEVALLDGSFVLLLDSRNPCACQSEVGWAPKPSRVTARWCPTLLPRGRVTSSGFTVWLVFNPPW
jgi:hypothetical protein